MEIRTASDIKYMYKKKQPEGHFFDRKTMQFFGDTMSNYYVPIKNGKARVVKINDIKCYALQRKKPVDGGITATTYFAIDTFECVLES